MKNHNPFKGKKVTILAPGYQIDPNCIDISDESVVCAVGNWLKFKPILIPRIVQRVDFCYPGPSEVIRMNYYHHVPSIYPQIRTAKEHQIEISPIYHKMISFYNFNFDWYCKEVGCNLTTGMAAILDVFLGHPESISLHGFNFYQTEDPYIKGYASKFDTRLITATKGDLSGHNQHLLLSYFIRHILPHIQIDQPLQAIIDQFTGYHP